MVIQLADGAAHADGRDDFTTCRKHGCGNTTNTHRVLFVIDRVTTPTDRRELFQQMRQRHDRARGNGAHRTYARDPLHLLTAQLTDQRLTNRRHLRRDTTTIPDVHLDETG